MKSNMFWYTISCKFNVCVIWGGGGPSLKPSQGLGYRGKEHSSQGNRRLKGPIKFEGKGNIWEQGKYGEQGNRYHLLSLGGPHQ